MKKKLIIIISIFLAVLIMALSLGLTLSKCTSNKKIVNVVVDADDTSSNNDTTSDDQDSSRNEDQDPYISDNISLSNGFTDYEAIDPNDFVNTKTEFIHLSANNNEENIASPFFRGITGTVYWSSEYLGLDPAGRQYTDEMIDMELERLRDAGIHYLRTGFWSDWMYTGNPDSPWDANTETMHRFYDWCKKVETYGMQVIIVFAWSPTFVHGGSQYLSEVEYLYPRKTDENGNKIVMNLFGTWVEEPDTELTNKRYSEWCVALLDGLKEHDVKNAYHLLLGTEPRENGGSAEGAFVEYQLDTYKTLHNKLVETGYRDDVILIGPNQSNITTRAGLASRFMAEAPEVFDIYSTHYTVFGQTSVDDCYADAAVLYDGWMEKMDNFELRFKQEFWCDEYSVNADKFGEHGSIDPWMAIGGTAGLIAATNAGISGINYWQLFDQSWPDYYESGGEYINGIQSDGASPSLYESQTPYPSYYGLMLYSKYMSYGDKTGVSYRCEGSVTDGLYLAMARLSDGNWSIIVVNHTTDTKSFQIDIAESLGGATMYRYLYNVQTADSDVYATPITADKGFSNVKNILVDTLNGGSIAVYSTIKDIAEQEDFL